MNVWALVHPQAGGLAISAEDIHFGSVASAVSHTGSDWSGGNKGELPSLQGALNRLTVFTWAFWSIPFRGYIFEPAFNGWESQVVQSERCWCSVDCSLSCGALGVDRWEGGHGTLWGTNDLLLGLGHLTGCKCWVWRDHDVRTIGIKKGLNKRNGSKREEVQQIRLLIIKWTLWLRHALKHERK